MKRGTIDHPKLWHLASALNTTRRDAVGLLEMLWHWTARYAPRGDVGMHGEDAIARAVDWDADPSRLCLALVETGWMDHNDDSYFVHDWDVHADDAVRKSLERRQENFANGSPARLGSTPRTNSGNQAARQRRDNGETPSRQRRDSPSPEPSPEPVCKKKTRSASADPPVGDHDPAGTAVEAAWNAICAAFAMYPGPTPAKLTPARRRLLSARQKEHAGNGVLESAVHGYWAIHRTSASGGWDPAKNSTPETIFRASNCAKYIEAHDQLVASGELPPYTPRQAATSPGPEKQVADFAAETLRLAGRKR